MNWAALYFSVGLLVALYDLVRSGGPSGLRDSVEARYGDKHGSREHDPPDAEILEKYWGLLVVLSFVATVMLCPFSLVRVVVKEVRGSYEAGKEAGEK